MCLGFISFNFEVQTHTTGLEQKNQRVSYFFSNSCNSGMISSKNVYQIKQLENLGQRSIICNRKMRDNSQFRV